MAEPTQIVAGKEGTLRPAENPISGVSYVGPAVTGTGYGKGIPGVSGASYPPIPVALAGGAVTDTQPKPTIDQIGDGIYGTGLNGVHGVSAYSAGVLGESTGSGPGVSGTSTGGVGISGDSTNQDGVYGQSTGAFGVHGRNMTLPDLPSVGGPPSPPSATPPTPPSMASTFKATECGVFGESYVSTGVFGGSVFQYGVHGMGGAPSGLAPTQSVTVGVRADSSTGYGVYATAVAHAAVFGQTSAAAEAGVHGVNTAAFPCTAVLGTGGAGHGVQGVNGSGSGKTPTAGCGVWGDSDQGFGVFGASKSGKAGMFDGDVSVTGNISASDVILSGADCAEEFDIASALAPGVVAVIDADGALTPCARAYDKRVAGVVSGAGAYRPAIVLDRRVSARERAAVALVGKVFCWVDATEAPIEVGDMLTSSATPGHAMRASDPARAFGAVIGKALRPMRSGRGLLPILVALQ